METLIVVLLFLVFFFTMIIKAFKSSDKPQSSTPSSGSSTCPSSKCSPITSHPKYEAPIHDPNKVTIVKFKVAGLFYRLDYCQERAARLFNYEPLLLKAEPNNASDPNAIMIFTEDWIHIGYMPKEIAAKFHSHLDKLIECHLDYKYPDGRIYCLNVSAAFDCMLPEAYDSLIHDYDIKSQYEEKYPGLNDSLFYYDKDPDKAFQILNQALVDNPNDFFLRYSYLRLLSGLARFEEAKSYIDQLLLDFPISKNSSCLINEHNYIDGQIRRKQERELRSQINFKLGQAKVFLQEKQYDKALPLLLFCYENDFQRQQLITDICKCYKQTNDKEHLIEFANDALKKEWISPKTAGMLTSLISL